MLHILCSHSMYIRFYIGKSSAPLSSRSPAQGKFLQVVLPVLQQGLKQLKTAPAPGCLKTTWNKNHKDAKFCSLNFPNVSIDKVMSQIRWDLQKIQPAVLVFWVVLERWQKISNLFPVFQISSSKSFQGLWHLTNKHCVSFLHSRASG